MCGEKQSHEKSTSLDDPQRSHKRSLTRGALVNHPLCRIGLIIPWMCNLLVMHLSSARLGPVWNQLKLELFQLGSARLLSFFSQLALQNLGSTGPKLGKMGN